VAYREFRARHELSDLVACTWERAVPRDGAAPTHRVMPDGCVDLIWRVSELVVAGPDRGPVMSRVEAGGTVVGLRLRPGAAGLALGLPASELTDQRPPLDSVWGRVGAELAERVGAADSPRLKRAELEAALLSRRPGMEDPDPLVAAATRGLGLPGSRVRSLSVALHTSERQLLRRFRAAVGYGPKTLDRVLRFRRFLARAPAVVDGDEVLAGLAAELGYADQAHLTRECVALSALTPARLAASAKPPRPPRSADARDSTQPAASFHPPRARPLDSDPLAAR
jgi:AraC-like DNA-binding protein